MRAALIVVAVLVATPAAAGEAEVRAAIEAGVPAELGLVELEVPAALRKARGAPSVAWKAAPRAGRASVRVTVGKTEAWVRFRLAARRPVVVAARALRAGDAVAAGDLVVEPRAADDGLALSADALVGRRVLAAVGAGAVVTADDVELPPPVARGAEVDVIVRRGGLTVSTTGALEGAAQVGAEVAVRIAATRAIKRGRLVDAGTVVIDGGAP